MADWRDHILKEFTPELSRLTLVADPDGLLTEETVQAGIRERGFELITFDDPIAFRFAYESKYRSLWDAGQKTELVVALRAESDSLRHLPYDLLKAGRTLDFRLPQIFPNLSYPVLQQLKPAEWDKIYQAQLLDGGSVLGDHGTMDFILDHAFDCLPKHSWTAKDLLRALLRHHYTQRELPTNFAGRVVKLLKLNPVFNKWPLEQIVGNRAGFLQFLQEQWPHFVENQLTSALREKSSGDLGLPFAHDDVRVYLDNYFAEGLLRPVQHDPEIGLPSGWMSVGLTSDPIAMVSSRLAKIVVLLKAELPSPTAASTAWQNFAFRLAEFNALCLEADKLKIVPSEDLSALRGNVDAQFSRWLQERYSTLASQSPFPPVMVHHIPRHLARIREEKKRPVALIVIDGLALEQWNILRLNFSTAHPSWVFTEKTAFAWIPTLTPVSRQAIFAGKIPFFFGATIDTTSKESNHWKAFWSDQGVPDHKSSYVKITSAIEKTDWQSLLPSLGQLDALAVVLTAVDEVVHGIVLGSAQLDSSVRIWNDAGTLTKLIGSLLDADFHIAIASDHGNTPAAGVGSPKEGLLAEVRGERVRIYPNEILRATSAAALPSSLAWTPSGLPTDFHPLFAPSQQAFFNPGEFRICHGGISVEEVLVPFVEISNRERHS
jgi:hypothetical protein